MFKRMLALLLWTALCGGAGVGALARADEAPQAVVETTANRMLEALKREQARLRQDPRLIYGLVEQIAVPRFDFEAISQWALGRNWRVATPEQQRAFTEQFRMLLVRTYGNALLEYSDEAVRFLPTSAPNADGDVLVRSEFQPKAGPAVPINYSLHQKAGRWLVYDVTVDGVSLVSSYRSTFANQVRDGGVDKVISSLADLNARGSTTRGAAQ